MAKAKEIAEWLDVELAAGADSEAELFSVSSIEAATPTSVVFATDTKTLALALASSAGIILANRTLGAIEGDTRILRVPDARFAFTNVAKRLKKHSFLTQIHPNSVVDPSARIGEGTQIGPHSVIGANVIIGRNCEIGPNVTIYSDTKIGDRVSIQAGAVLGSKGFGYARDAATGEYTLFRSKEPSSSRTTSTSARTRRSIAAHSAKPASVVAQNSIIWSILAIIAASEST